MLTALLKSVYYRYLHLLWSGKLAEWRNRSVGEVFLRTAASFPSKVMVTLCTKEGEEKMTFLEVEQFSCRLANYFLQQVSTVNLTFITT